MLSVAKRNMLRSFLAYFIDKTGVSADGFILLVQRNISKDIDTLDDTAWLAVSIYKSLKENGISLSDCLEYRNLAFQLKLERRGINVETVWKKKIAEYIKNTDVSRYELFEISDENSELQFINFDFPKEVYVYNQEHGENFYTLKDFNPAFDSEASALFRSLPVEIQKAIRMNLPLFINFNPYLEQKKNFDSIYDDMKFEGYGNKVYKNFFYATLFAIIQFCVSYNLTNVRIGFYAPLDMFYEKEEYADFYKKFKRYFNFNSGICFSPKSVGVKDKAENISYMIWDYTKEEKRFKKPIILDKYVQHTKDTILKDSLILVRGQREALYDWIKRDTELIKDEINDEVPMFLSIQNKTDKKIMRTGNVLGYQIYSPNLLRSIKRLGISSVPLGNDYLEITEENILKSIAAYAVRSCYNKAEFTNPPYLSSPDTSVDGYKTWLADALVYFLFNTNNMVKSYREKDLELSNRLFPFEKSDVKRYIKDENILYDLKKYGEESRFFPTFVKEVTKYLSEDGKEFYAFCKRKIFDSLKGDIRQMAGYKDSLVAWDAGWYQIRGIENFFSSDDEERYSYLLSKVQDGLFVNIKKFGFVSLET